MSDRPRSGRRFALVVVLTILIASVTDHAIAAWIGLWDGFSREFATETGTYRRIGPEHGPQVFVAGASLMQFALSWPEVANALGRGIENWGIAGSSPEIWEVSQRVATNSNVLMIGVSVYDLNEERIADSRARIVPLWQTIRDLRDSNASWELSERILSQYPLTYARILFPTASNSDRVLVGVRKRTQELLGFAASREDKENELFLPSKPVLEFGESTVKVSDWAQARLLRRLDLLRAENHGLHSFAGPKQLVFRRMMDRAQRRGAVVVVVLPVTQAYLDTFATPDVSRRFEQALDEAVKPLPDAQVIRLDRVPGITANENFSDLVHLNSTGRRLATAAFLRQLKLGSHVQ